MKLEKLKAMLEGAEGLSTLRGQVNLDLGEHSVTEVAQLLESHVKILLTLEAKVEFRVPTQFHFSIENHYYWLDIVVAGTAAISLEVSQLLVACSAKRFSLRLFEMNPGDDFAWSVLQAPTTWFKPGCSVEVGEFLKDESSQSSNTDNWFTLSSTALTLYPRGLQSDLLSKLKSFLTQVSANKLATLTVLAGSRIDEVVSLDVVWEAVSTIGVTERISCKLQPKDSVTHAKVVADFAKVDFNKVSFKPLTIEVADCRYVFQQSKFSNSETTYIAIKVDGKSASVDGLLRLCDALKHQVSDIQFVLNINHYSSLSGLVLGLQFNQVVFGVGYTEEQNIHLQKENIYIDETFRQQFSYNHLVKRLDYSCRESGWLSDDALTAFLSHHAPITMRVQIHPIPGASNPASIRLQTFKTLVVAAAKAEKVERFDVNIVDDQAELETSILQVCASDAVLQMPCGNIHIASAKMFFHLFPQTEKQNVLVLKGEVFALKSDITFNIIQVLHGKCKKANITLAVLFSDFRQATPVLSKLLLSDLITSKHLVATWHYSVGSDTKWRYEGYVFDQRKFAEFLEKPEIKTNDKISFMTQHGILMINLQGSSDINNLIEPLASYCNRQNVYKLIIFNMPLNQADGCKNLNELVTKLKTVSDYSFSNCELHDTTIGAAFRNLGLSKRLRSLEIDDPKLLNVGLSYDGLRGLVDALKGSLTLAALTINVAEICDENVIRLKSQKPKHKKSVYNFGKSILYLKFNNIPIRTSSKAESKAANSAVETLNCFGEIDKNKNDKQYRSVIDIIKRLHNKADIPKSDNSIIANALDNNRLSLYAFDINTGDTLLHTCVRHNCIGVAKLLLQRNFNLAIRNKMNQTVQELAQSEEKAEFITLLDDHRNGKLSSQALSTNTSAASKQPSKKRKATTQAPKGDAPPAKLAGITPSLPSATAMSSSAVTSQAFATASTRDNPVTWERPERAAITPTLAAGNSSAALAANLQTAITRRDYKLVKQLSASLKQPEFNLFQAVIAVADSDLLHFLLCHPILSKALYAQPTKTNYYNLLQLTTEIKTQLSTFAQAIQSNRSLRIMLGMLHSYHGVTPIPMADGLIWCQDMHIIYGGRYSKHKSVNIPAASIHTALKAQTDAFFDRLRAQQFKKVISNDMFEAEDEAEFKESTVGNIVSASLSFVISDREHIAGGEHQRIAVTVPILSEQTFTYINITEDPADDEKRNAFKNNLVNRVQRVESMAATLGAKSSAEITTLFEDRVNYYQTFHHSEQALYHYLETDAGINLLINALGQAPEFTFGCKVYAVILDMHSAPKYMCGNCQLSALGLQHSDSQFMTKLKTGLRQQGCVISPNADLRMLTRVTAEQPSGDSSTVNTFEELERRKQQHHRFFVDVRYVKNNLILAQDVNVTAQSGVIFSSRNR